MDLSELAERVSSAVAEAKAPPPPGGSKPIVWPTDLLGEEGWSLLWQVVRQIRERAPETFVRFPELTLGLRVADELENDPGLDFDTLLARLADAAEEYGPRVVSTSICNVVMASSAVNWPTTRSSCARSPTRTPRRRTRTSPPISTSRSG